MFTSQNPATAKVITTYGLHEPDEVERRLATADAVTWTQLGVTPVEQQVAWMRELATLMDARANELARLMVAEMGKPIGEALTEVAKCATVLRYYADVAPAALADDPREGGVVLYQPLGALLAIMPWNFPFLAGPHPRARNRPGEDAPAQACGERRRLGTRAGVPGRGVGAAPRHPLGPAGAHDEVPSLIADERVQGVTLTGSVRAGRAVAEVAGRSGKESVLELGGSDPFLVHDDADVDAVAALAAQARLLNGGQACVSSKRFIVMDAIADRFVERLAAELDDAVVGPPEQAATTVGPLARHDLLENLERQVRATIDQGATFVRGGHRLAGPGCFYRPTVLADVQPDHVAAMEETFGPVAAVLRVRSVEEAIAVANDTQFGLGAVVCAQDEARVREVARRLRGRQRGGQLPGHLPACDALRRSEGLRLWPRARGRGVARVREHQGGPVPDAKEPEVGKMEICLEGRKALVTGASAGLGEAIVRSLTASGAEVATVARREALLVERAAALAAETGARVVPITADVTSREDCARLVEEANSALGHVDLLINCAGGSRTMPLEATEEMWREAMEVNFWSKHRITHALVPGMMERRFGRIINISGSLEPKSIPLYHDHSRRSNMNAASAAKAALHIWAKGLSREVGPYGVTVNSIPPGRLITEQTLRRYPTEEVREQYCRELRIAVGRFGEADELASLVTFLCSDHASYITGELIHVDGGMRNYAF